MCLLPSGPRLTSARVAARTASGVAGNVLGEPYQRIGDAARSVRIVGRGQTRSADPRGSPKGFSMPRTATRRRALAAALACAAMLSACTGNSDDGTAGTGVSGTPVVAAGTADTNAAAAA